MCARVEYFLQDRVGDHDSSVGVGRWHPGPAGMVQEFSYKTKIWSEILGFSHSVGASFRGGRLISKWVIPGFLHSGGSYGGVGWYQNP